jgi:hypothetical protein
MDTDQDYINSNKKVDELINDFHSAVKKFEKKLQKPKLIVDFLIVCNGYQSELFSLCLELNQHKIKLEKKYGLTESSDDELYKKIKNISPAICKTHNLISMNRQEFYNRRIESLENQGIFNESSKIYCECDRSNQVQDTVKINFCPLCYDKNVQGVTLTCCKKKQKICIKCLNEYLKTSYASTTKTELMDETLFDSYLCIHHKCPFCRMDTCFSHYYHLLENYIDSNFNNYSDNF